MKIEGGKLCSPHYLLTCPVGKKTEENVTDHLRGDPDTPYLLHQLHIQLLKRERGGRKNV